MDLLPAPAQQPRVGKGCHLQSKPPYSSGGEEFGEVAAQEALRQGRDQVQERY